MLVLARTPRTPDAATTRARVRPTVATGLRRRANAGHPANVGWIAVETPAEVGNACRGATVCHSSREPREAILRACERPKHRARRSGGRKRHDKRDRERHPLRLEAVDVPVHGVPLGTVILAHDGDRDRCADGVWRYVQREPAHRKATARRSDVDAPRDRRQLLLPVSDN
jgi:hypothetical protein